LPAKAAYGKFDMQRACNYFGTSQNKTPDFFPILSIMVNNNSLGQVLGTKNLSKDDYSQNPAPTLLDLYQKQP
jgi:hypothetical protein